MALRPKSLPPRGIFGIFMAKTKEIKNYVPEYQGVVFEFCFRFVNQIGPRAKTEHRDSGGWYNFLWEGRINDDDVSRPNALRFRY